MNCENEKIDFTLFLKKIQTEQEIYLFSNFEYFNDTAVTKILLRRAIFS